MSKIINIMTTIDTDAVKAAYPAGGTEANPIGIAHNMGFMICTGTTVNAINGKTTQGTGDLDFNALVGDTVRYFATSGSDNFEDAVLIYGLPKFSGDQVLSTFAYREFTKSTVVPQSETSVLPARIVEESFWFYQADVVRKGTEAYKVQFTLYTRDSTTGAPVLRGYYAWDPTIRVQG